MKAEQIVIREGKSYSQPMNAPIFRPRHTVMTRVAVTAKRRSRKNLGVEVSYRRWKKVERHIPDVISVDGVDFNCANTADGQALDHAHGQLGAPHVIPELYQEFLREIDQKITDLHAEREQLLERAYTLGRSVLPGDCVRGRTD